jgi:hypothetical protein
LAFADTRLFGLRFWDFRWDSAAHALNVHTRPPMNISIFFGRDYRFVV